MTRKNTIIMAALVNCIFIIALFSTATKGSSGANLLPIASDLKPQEAAVFSTDTKSIEDYPQAALEKSVQLPDPILDHVPPLDSLSGKSANPGPAPIETQSQNTTATPKAPKAPSYSLHAKPSKDENSSSLVEIEVKRGDVLEKIARANGTSVSKIMEINHLKSSMLRIGQKLLVPKTGAVASQRKAPEPEAGPQFYVVKKGDNLWVIATRFKVQVSQLKALNHLDDGSAKKLRVGDELRIR